jgi:hypothetical protein
LKWQDSPNKNLFQQRETVNQKQLTHSQEQNEKSFHSQVKAGNLPVVDVTSIDSQMPGGKLLALLSFN